ncbi:MAG: HAMP domain-containing protein [Phycisphaerae bacterium]|nr:HAMP domain-containing protein [Phycisphaerae bacterium]
MLHRKLLIRIGLLVACFVAGAAVAVYLLQSAIPQIDQIHRDDVTLIDGMHTVSECFSQLEDARNGIAAASATGCEARLETALDEIGKHPAVWIADSPQARTYARLRACMHDFLHPESLTPDEVQANRADVRSAVRDLTRELRAYTSDEQAWFSRYFRGLVLGLTLAALLMMNVAVFVLVRTAQMVLKPVGELVQGSRELAAEHFDHRVRVTQQDEFGELAHAYNRLAEQLQSNEERKAEAIRQLAVTLNHDLNNAMATMEMQLSLLDRQSGNHSSLAKYIREIQSSLARMANTVASLKHVRRVVLADYLDGQKMVDLEQSVKPLPVAAPTPAGEPVSGRRLGTPSRIKAGSEPS